jgi:drug/metabolite transporter (DMT)-like permease
MMEETASPANISKARAAGAVEYWVPALAASITLAAVGHLSMKAALIHANGVPLHSLADRLSYHVHHPLLLIGLAAYAVGTVLWIFAVSRKEISFLYPLTAANYAVIAVGGQMLFGESVSTLRWAGIAVVMVGVILMNRSSQEAA